MDNKMQLAVSSENIINLLIKQIDNIFFIEKGEIDLLKSVFVKVLSRCEYCFAHQNNKYYSNNGAVFFSPFHSGQYSIFLYFYSNQIWKEGNSMLADKLYYLNKSLNACDLFYEIELPSIFMLDHPVGTVMGRANYSDYFSFAQNCTVGNNNGIYPTIGYNVRMCANSMIIGDCIIGNNVTLAANSCIKDENIESDTIVFGSSPFLVKKHKE
jgi:serine O-acetyltransferase